MIRKTLTIFFADVQGYTSRTGRQTREQNELFIKEIRAFVARHAQEKNGTLVKTMGDGFLLTFESPTDAVVCGWEMQKQMEQRNANVLDQEHFVRLRIGISTGEVTRDESGDVFGDVVNIAARIQNYCDPNEVYISESTYLAMNKAEVQALDLGPQRFKNVVPDVRVYRVVDKNSDPSRLRPARRGSPKKMLVAAATTATVIAIITPLLMMKNPAGAPPKDPAAVRPDIERLLREGNYAALISWAKQELQKAPQDANLQLVAGEACLRSGDLTNAEYHLSQARQIAPDKPAAYRFLAQTYEQRGDFSGAIQMLADFLLREKDPQARQEALDKMRELEESKARITVTMRGAPYPGADAAESGGRGETSSHPGPGEQASFPYQPARRTAGALNSADNRDTIRQLLEQGRFDEVLRIAQQQAQDEPDNPRPHLLLGDMYLRLHRLELAEEHLLRALQLSPDMPMTYHKIGQLYEMQGRTADALRMFREYVQLEPRNIQRQEAEQRIAELEQERRD